MADGAVQFLLEKLTTLVVQKASLIGDSLDEFEEIKLEFEGMKAFLRDADSRKERDDGVGSWVRQVREVAHDVEDIIDEFMHLKENRNYHHLQQRNGFNDLLYNVLHFPKKIISSHDIAVRMQKIKVKVHSVLEMGNRYGFDRIDDGRSLNDDAERWRLHRDNSIFLDDDEIVGMEEDREELLQWLEGAETRRRIISIVGMGGLGKTTLVTKVFHDQVVSQQFDCCAWISVSQTYRIEELLRRMIEECFVPKQVLVPSNLGSMDYRQLVNVLIDYLHQKSYLIVLDDVWSIDLWSKVRVAFPNNKAASRIILTTRNENVASSVGIGSRVHRLQPLLENNAWILFCHKAFWNNQDRTCPLELQCIARKVLRKCEGLPLAIVAIGGLMSSREQTAIEWKKVYESLNSQLINNPVLESVKGILLLSFNDLPYYLKHCFLYCCVFRDGHAIKRKKLIRLWVAEGFIEERRGMTMEDLAEDYLKELVLRNMIQVIETNEAGRVKTCRVHDVMRELAISTSEKENFCATYDGKSSRLDARVRRLSIHNSLDQIRMTKSTLHHLRSFFVFDKDTFSLSGFREMSSNFRLLRVLDLQGIPLETAPDGLVGLFNLSYLNLRDTKITELPKSIGRLKKLQCLDVRNTNLVKLPNGIARLSNLRHLYMYRCSEKYSCSGVMAPLAIQDLQSLQTLACIEANDRELVKQLRNLLELRRLEVTKLKAGSETELCSSIQKMSSLLNLGLAAENEEDSLELKELSPPNLLQKLKLVGQLKRLPHWLGTLTNLTHLRLHRSRLPEDHNSQMSMLSPLKPLSSLVFLELWRACEVHELHFHSGWFPRLNKLKLRELKHLNCVRVEQGALPSIVQLYLIQCEELKAVPQGIEHLTGLHMLYLEEMPNELVQRLDAHNGEDNFKVQHITTIKHVSQTQQIRIVETLG